jgi:hypothetical protein
MSALARLLAGENIAVIHSPSARTALFDLSKRHLVLPCWDNMSPVLYDLLLTHEISHALHTPLEGWHQSVTKHGRAFKGYLNVLEDVRIERLIKLKYPGLNRVFSAAYSELIQRDFFGLRKHKLNVRELEFIDRINIHAKCGALMSVEFSKEEQVMVDEAFATETFAEVQDLAERLFKLDQAKIRVRTNRASGSLDELLEKLDEARKMLKELRERGSEAADLDDEDEDDGDEELDDEYVAPARKTTGDFKEMPASPDRDSLLTEGEKEEEKALEKLREAMSDKPLTEAAKKKAAEQAAIDEKERFKHTSSDDDLSSARDAVKKLEKQVEEEIAKTPITSGGGGVDTPRSLTDEAFREAEESLLESTEGKHLYGNDEKILILDEVDLSKFVVPADKVNAQIKLERTDDMYKSRGHFSFLPTKDSLAKFLRDEQKVINQLAAEFEMRKNASQYARSGSSKTGAINMKRLHAARLSDDIFQRIVKVPEGKSHAMMMMFDQSGSMQNIYKKTIEQIIVLIEFCRRMNIPFEVYGFNSDPDSYEVHLPTHYSYPETPTPGRIGLSNHGIHLKQYIHSSMPVGEYKEALYNLWTLRSHDARHFTEGLGGCTPMNQALLLSGSLVKKMKLKTKADVVNVVVLTDGDATDSIGTSSGRNAYNSGTMRVLYNGVLSQKMKQDYHNAATMTAGISKLMADATGANYVGVYIPSTKQSAKGAIRRYHDTVFFSTANKPAKYTMDKDGFFMTENFGFNSFFIIKPLDEAVVALDTDVGKKTATQIAKSFSKVAAGRVQNRAFLSVFATQIAE